MHYWPDVLSKFVHTVSNFTWKMYNVQPLFLIYKYRYWRCLHVKNMIHKDPVLNLFWLYLWLDLRKTTFHVHLQTFRNADFKYREQQKLSGSKLSWFSWILAESRKFSLLIDRRRAADIIVEAKLWRFSQHYHKFYQTTKLFSHLTFVVYSIWIAVSQEWKHADACMQFAIVL